MKIQKVRCLILMLAVGLTSLMLAACDGTDIKDLDNELAHTLVTCPPPNCPPDTIYSMRVFRDGQSYDYSVDASTNKSAESAVTARILKITPAQGLTAFAEENLETRIAELLVKCPPPNCPPDTLPQAATFEVENLGLKSIYEWESTTKLGADSISIEHTVTVSRK